MMTTQTPAPATLGHARAIERAGYLQRRDVALAELAGRADAPAPMIQDGDRPKPTPPFMLGEALVQALLAEAVVRLADEVDELREQLAAQQAPVSATTNGGNTR